MYDLSAQFEIMSQHLLVACKACHRADPATQVSVDDGTQLTVSQLQATHPNLHLQLRNCMICGPDLQGLYLDLCVLIVAFLSCQIDQQFSKWTVDVYVL